MSLRNLFAEKLNIVKKKSTKDLEKIKEYDPLIIGVIKDVRIYKSLHSTEKRGKISRDYKFSDKFLTTVVGKILKSSDFKSNQTTAVVFKNEKGTYDLAVVSLQGKVFTIITIIKKNKETPEKALPSARTEQSNIIIESGKTYTYENLIYI